MSLVIDATIICLDYIDEYMYALKKLRHEASYRNAVLYLYSSNGFLCVSDEYNRFYIAKAFPGGRLESRRGYVNENDL